MRSKRAFRRFTWADLSAFDEHQPDLGVAGYLENAGFTLDVVSLLFLNPDIIHLHEGRVDDTPLTMENSSYSMLGRKREWTRAKVKRLVQSLQQRSVRVLIGPMTNAYHPRHEAISPFAESHPELLVVDKNGAKALWEAGRFGGQLNFNPLAFFADGTPYGVFFAEKLAQVIRDYGFDGFQGGDGYKSLLKTLEHMDYSDQSIALFEKRMGIEVPLPPKNRKAPPSAYRAEWIWERHRRQWIDFFVLRWTDFWAAVVHKCGDTPEGVYINGPWGCSPTEAIWRFGVDYKALQRVGVRGLLVENIDGVLSWYGALAGPTVDSWEGYELPWEDLLMDMTSAILLSKGYAPGLELIPFTASHDEYESCELLTSERRYMEKAVFAFTQNYLADKGGDLRPAADGTTLVVGTNILQPEWAWVREHWDLAFGVKALHAPGPVLVWSDTALDREVDEAGSHWSTHRVLYRLMAAGLPVISIARLEEVEETEAAALLVVNPSSWDPADVKRVLRRSTADRPVILFGRGVADPGFTEGHGKEGGGVLLRVDDSMVEIGAVVHGGQAHRQRVRERIEAGLGRAGMDSSVTKCDVADESDVIRVHLIRKSLPLSRPCTSEMRAHFMTRIPGEEIPDSLLGLSAELLRPLCWPRIREVTLRRPGDVWVPARGQIYPFTVDISAEESVLFLFNHSHRSAWAAVEMDAPLAGAEVLGDYRMQMKVAEARLEVVIPTNGARAVKLRWRA